LRWKRIAGTAKLKADTNHQLLTLTIENQLPWILILCLCLFAYLHLTTELLQKVRDDTVKCPSLYIKHAMRTGQMHILGTGKAVSRSEEQWQPHSLIAVSNSKLMASTKPKIRSSFKLLLICTSRGFTHGWLWRRIRLRGAFYCGGLRRTKLVRLEPQERNMLGQL